MSFVIYIPEYTYEYNHGNNSRHKQIHSLQRHNSASSNYEDALLFIVKLKINTSHKSNMQETVEVWRRRRFKRRSLSHSSSCFSCPPTALFLRSLCTCRSSACQVSSVALCSCNKALIRRRCAPNHPLQSDTKLQSVNILLLVLTYSYS